MVLFIEPRQDAGSGLPTGAAWRECCVLPKTKRKAVTEFIALMRVCICATGKGNKGYLLTALHTVIVGYDRYFERVAD